MLFFFKPLFGQFDLFDGNVFTICIKTKAAIKLINCDDKNNQHSLNSGISDLVKHKVTSKPEAT